MVFYNEHCAGILGLFVCQGFEAQPQQQGYVTGDHFSG